MDTLRPQQWAEYIGQPRLKEELRVRIDSAIIDDRPLDHVLLCGPPGAGKTSFAAMVADRLQEPFETVTMPINLRSLTRLIQDFKGIVLFDEIHRCSQKEQEMLLPLLEFGYVQDTNGRRITTDWLTVIGATTERQQLISPLVDRFPIKPDYEEYTDEEMAMIVKSMARKAGLELDDETAAAFGVAATGTPRNARQFVLAYRDLKNSHGRTPSTEQVLDLCRTSSDGLTSRHMRYLETLYALGGTKGLSVLVSLLRMTAAELQELERLLIQKGYLTFSERGRELTSAGMTRARGGRNTATRRRREPAT